jgi:hypothetical protein
MNIANYFKLSKVEHILADGEGYYVEDNQCVFGNLIMGLELEIENFRYDTPVYATRHEEDGSLRNNGCEVITSPIRHKYLRSLLDKVVKTHRLTEDNYSDRTSVHVHVNVQDMTEPQLATLFLTYQSVERLLFSFVGEERENNIFCVPLYQAGIATGFVSETPTEFLRGLRRWQKYTAFNVIPVSEQGTVEFRHLYGTCDVDTICNWLNLIACLFKYSTSVSYEDAKKRIMRLNTESNYEQYVVSIFGDLTPLVFSGDLECTGLLHRGVIDSKLSLK